MRKRPELGGRLSDFSSHSMRSSSARLACPRTRFAQTAFRISFLGSLLEPRLNMAPKIGQSLKTSSCGVFSKKIRSTKCGNRLAAWLVQKGSTAGNTPGHYLASTGGAVKSPHIGGDLVGVDASFGSFLRAEEKERLCRVQPCIIAAPYQGALRARFLSRN